MFKLASSTMHVNREKQAVRFYVCIYRTVYTQDNVYL